MTDADRQIVQNLQGICSETPVRCRVYDKRSEPVLISDERTTLGEIPPLRHRVRKNK